MPELLDWLAILSRWGHVMAGIAWIGTSFYFNRFDLSVRPTADPVLKENVRGTLHEVHGGSFYYHEQYWPSRDVSRLLAHGGPAQLTLLTGLGLMALFYRYGADVYLIDPGVAMLSKGHAVVLSVGSLLLAWPLYNKLCRTVRSDRAVFVWMAVATALAACLFSHLFGGRAAFIQVGNSRDQSVHPGHGDPKGRLRTHAPSTYKIPACSDRPRDLRMAFAEWSENQAESVYTSKAIGEPPLCLGISVFAALCDAVRQANPGKPFPGMNAPATAEAILGAIDRGAAGCGRTGQQ